MDPVHDGEPVRWGRHLARLLKGCRRLRISEPDVAILEGEARTLCAGHGQAVLKMIVTRGAGTRGYASSNEVPATRILGLYPRRDYPSHYGTRGVAVRVCSTRLGVNPSLAGIKHLNRLENVAARLEWDDEAFEEGLMLDVEEFVIEATAANLFLVTGERLVTPRLDRCGVAGIMREIIVETASAMGIPVSEARVTLADLETADELFLSNTLIGIWPIRQVGQRRVPVGPLAGRIRESLGS
jgi:4-amino-4-deoxychorismate lyase